SPRTLSTISLHEAFNLPTFVSSTTHTLHVDLAVKSGCLHKVGISTPIFLAASSIVVPDGTSTSISSILIFIILYSTCTTSYLKHFLQSWLICALSSSSLCFKTETNALDDDCPNPQNED